MSWDGWLPIVHGIQGESLAALLFPWDTQTDEHSADICGKVRMILILLLQVLLLFLRSPACLLERFHLLDLA